MIIGIIMSCSMHHSRVCSGIDVNMLTVLTTTCHWLVYLAYFLIILSEVTPTRTYIKNDCRQATPSCIFSLGGILFVHPWFILLVFIKSQDALAKGCSIKLFSHWKFWQFLAEYWRQGQGHAVEQQGSRMQASHQEPLPDRPIAIGLCQ